MNRGIRKLQSLYFNGKLFANRKAGLPAQTGKEIQIFKAVFDNFSGKEKIKIFEWGSGLSTIYYAEYLRRRNVTFSWQAVDNDKAWYELTKAKINKQGLQPYVQIYLKEFQPFWEKPGWGTIPPPIGVFGPKSDNEKAYIDYPRQLKERFDIVIVDARFRRHCIQTAKEVLEPNGIVVMHDAQKEHYHVGLGDFQHTKFFLSGSWYPFQKEPNKVWVGSLSNQEIFKALKQF